MATQRTPAPLRAALSFNQMAAQSSRCFIAGMAGLVVNMSYAILGFIILLCGVVWIYQHKFPALDDYFCFGIEPDIKKFSKSKEIKLACEFVGSFCLIVLEILLATELCG